MKNKKMNLFAGLFVAFIMLAVPFAVISFHSENVDAESIDYGSEVRVKNQSELSEALLSEGNKTIVLTADIAISNGGTEVLSPFATISESGNKWIQLGNYDITVEDFNRFLVVSTGTSINVKISADVGKITAPRIVKFSYVNGSSLEIDGGFYEAEYTAFLIYGQSGQVVTNDVLTVSNATIDAASAESNDSEAGIWFSNYGANIMTVSNSIITSGDIGIYCGVMKSALFDDVTIDATNTALEIKSGDITIKGGLYSSDNYSISGTINTTNGSGDQVSTIFINDAYVNKGTSTESVSVTIDDACSITNAEGAPVILGSVGNGIYFSWKNAESEDDVTIIPGDYTSLIDCTSGKPVDSETTVVESESNEVTFDVSEDSIVTEAPLTVELYENEYSVTFPEETVISKGASVSITVNEDFDKEDAYNIHFNGIETNGALIQITLPCYDSGSRVYYYDENTGLYEEMEITSIGGGIVTFVTTHNSLYVIDSSSGLYDDEYKQPSVIENDDGIDTNVIYIAEIVLIVIALAGLAFVIRRK